VKRGIGLQDLALMLMAAMLLAGTMARAQSLSTPGARDDQISAIHDLREQVQQLRSLVQAMRSDEAQYHAQTEELRQELQATRSQMAALQSSLTNAAGPAPANAETAAESAAKAGSSPLPLEDRVTSLEESTQLLAGKVDEQYQTKVESASKYRVRLSGIVLLNLFSNRGSTDNQDFPSYVPQPTSANANGNFGATMRQSEIGLEIFGPHLAGARVTGNLQADFAGGFPYITNGVNSGIFRLRIASLRMDWGNTSVVAGQDDLFLSPLSPTSFASLAVPALSYAGNLWAWTPQVRVERRFTLPNEQKITLQAGFLDNLSGAPPYTQSYRSPDPGERSSQPGYGLRTSWTGNVLGRTVTLGTAGYYGRQDWGFNRHVDGWAGMADAAIPLTARLTLSGEFYRGRAIGGLGGGLGRSVLFSGNPLDPATQILGLNSIGGWSGLKFKANAKLEFNGAFGLDDPFIQDLRFFPAGQSYINPNLAQNRSGLVNFIYRPRSNLVLSTEYRRLHTSEVISDSYSSSQVNMVMGVLF